MPGDTKISALTALTRANLAAADNFVVVDTSGVVTARILASELMQLRVFIEAACADETTAITAATDKLTFRNPFGAVLTVTGVRCHVKSACTTGTFTVDINEAGTTILSTKLTLDATEKTSTTAATAAVISDTSIADDAIITVDVDNAGDGTATGLKIVIAGTIPL